MSRMGRLGSSAEYDHQAYNSVVRASVESAERFRRSEAAKKGWETRRGVQRDTRQKVGSAVQGFDTISGERFASRLEMLASRRPPLNVRLTRRKNYFK